MLDEEVFKAFIERFYGYGRYDSPYWFIGIEEGGGGTIEDVNRRLNVWRARAKCELEDLVDYHLDIGIDRYFTDPVRLQSTWNGIIRVYLADKAGVDNGRITHSDEIRAYQREHLGRTRSGNNICLLELFPLPSPGVNRWHYDEWTSLPMLGDRATYQAAVAPRRVKQLRERIANHKPGVVVCYGHSHKSHWIGLVDANPWMHEPDLGIYYIWYGQTLMVRMPHPVARRMSSERFAQIGRRIAALRHAGP